MPELIVRLSRNYGGMNIDQRNLPVYDRTPSAQDRVQMPGLFSKGLPVSNKPLDRRVLEVRVVGATKINPACCYMTRASLPVMAIRDIGAQKMDSRLLPVYDTKPSTQSYVTPSDDNPPEDGSSQRVSDITLDLQVSFDSYFKFSSRSEDGFRAVLGDDDTVIPSSSNGYEVEAPRVGSRVKRTVITNTGLNLVINLNPTIVKNASGI